MDRLPSLPDTNADDIYTNPPPPPSRSTPHTDDTASIYEYDTVQVESIYETPAARSESNPYAPAYRFSQDSNNPYSTARAVQDPSSSGTPAGKPYQRHIRAHVALQTPAHAQQHPTHHRQHRPSIKVYTCSSLLLNYNVC